MLHDQQRQMAQAVLQGSCDRPLEVAGIGPAARLSIHRVTVQDSLRQTLAAAYPCLESVLGVRNFGVLARAYIRDHPPRQAVLAAYGGELATYLETYRHTADKPALADLARLEWACLQTAFARDAEVLDLPALQALAPEDLLQSGLPLHPATELLHLDHDVERYKSGEVPWTGIKVEERNLAVLRKDSEVAVCTLGSGETALFSALAEGLDLETAAQAAFIRQPEFDLQRFLVKFLPLGTFTFPAGS